MYFWASGGAPAGAGTTVAGATVEPVLFPDEWLHPAASNSASRTIRTGNTRVVMNTLSYQYSFGSFVIKPWRCALE